MKFFLFIIAGGMILTVAGCWTITVKHKVDPIYITMDVNVKAEKQLNDFFDYEEQVGLSGTKSMPDDTKHKIIKEK